jgi:hypothetical protein
MSRPHEFIKLDDAQESHKKYTKKFESLNSDDWEDQESDSCILLSSESDDSIDNPKLIEGIDF